MESPGFPVASCTVATCSLLEGQVEYQPSLGGNAFYVAIFAIALVCQLVLGIRYRIWGFLVGMFCGLVLEIVGYANPATDALQSLSQGHIRHVWPSNPRPHSPNLTWDLQVSRHTNHWPNLFHRLYLPLPRTHHRCLRWRSIALQTSHIHNLLRTQRCHVPNSSSCRRSHRLWSGYLP